MTNPLFRKGPWIATHAGRRFYFEAPHPDDVDITDVAHALSNLCRFTGHVNRFYSVAEHSINVSLLVPPEDALQGLLHDAHEAYIGDCSSPLKRAIGYDYRRLDTAARFECMKPVPERISPKDMRNDCTFYEFRTTIEKDTAPSAPVANPHFAVSSGRE